MKIKIFYIILSIFFLFNACQKYDNISSFSPSADLLSQARKQFQEDSIHFYQSFDKMKYNYRQSLTRIIHWPRAKVIRDTIIVPITLKLAKGEINAETGGSTLNHKVYLIGYKNEKDKYSYEMHTFIGDNYKSRGKFTGTVFVENYFSGNVRYNTYLNGKVDKYNMINPRQTEIRASLGERGIIASSINCNWTKVGRTCVGDVNGGSAPDECSDRYEYQCHWNEDGPPVVSEEEYEDDSSGGGTGGGDPDPGTYDCAGVLNGGAYIGPCGKCIGGTTGITSCLDIINQLQGYPCAENLLNQLPNLNNEIAKWLKDAFINADNDIVFRALTTLPDTLDGYWNKNAANHSLQTITLNGNMLNTASQEYILATMYHEALHGFLGMEEQRLGEPDFSSTYSGFTRVPMSNGTFKYTVKHFEFSSQIQKLANAIRSFNPQMSEYDALALAKGGVIVQNSIETIINTNHRNGNTGTKCNTNP